MEVKGLLIDSFFDSITVKFKYRIGVRLSEKRFPVSVSATYMRSFLFEIIISERDKLFVGCKNSFLPMKNNEIVIVEISRKGNSRKFQLSKFSLIQRIH